LKNQLYEFQKLKPEDPRFTNTLTELFNDLKEHIREEEEHDLTALEASVEETHSNKLARSFDRTKMFVPTRSHPSAPNKPPYETAVGLLAAPLDKLRDMFSKFPEK
jgi:uncharacterized protein YdcH (DUF465 family)